MMVLVVQNVDKGLIFINKEKELYFSDTCEKMCYVSGSIKSLSC